MQLSFFEGATTLGLPGPGEVGAEQLIGNLVDWLKLGIEVTGAIMIGTGVVFTIWHFGGILRNRQLEQYDKARLVLARYLALGLEFQLAADIVATAFAPSWAQIGKLAAIAVIRTALNYFLGREIKEEQEEMKSLGTGDGNTVSGSS